MTKRLTYAGIGARRKSVPEELQNEVMQLQIDLGHALALEGYTLLSGGADFSDMNFEIGCDKAKGKKRIFIAWHGCGDRYPDKNTIDATTLPTYHLATAKAELIHPAWHRCGKGAKALHSRNPYQVLDKDLKSPVNFVVCFAEPKDTESDYVKGGTATAVEIAIQNDIIIRNMWYEKVRKEIREYIKKVFDKHSVK